jgi:four helix bundle protein
MNEKRYEDMDVWKDSMSVCETIYDISGKSTLSEDYGLKDQIRRSALSIPSNIAEGFERDSDKEFVRYLKIAKGSAGELRTQLILTKRIGHLTNDVAEKLLKEIENISKQIYGLIQYIKNQES